MIEEKERREEKNNSHASAETHKVQSSVLWPPVLQDKRNDKLSIKLEKNT